MPKLKTTRIPKGECSYCHENFMNCRCDSFHPNIISASFEDSLIVSKEEAKDLEKFFLSCGYISYEDYNEVHKFIIKLRRFLND